MRAVAKRFSLRLPAAAQGDCVLARVPTQAPCVRIEESYRILWDRLRLLWPGFRAPVPQTAEVDDAKEYATMSP